MVGGPLSWCAQDGRGKNPVQPITKHYHKVQAKAGNGEQRSVYLCTEGMRRLSALLVDSTTAFERITFAPESKRPTPYFDAGELLPKVRERFGWYMEPIPSLNEDRGDTLYRQCYLKYLLTGRTYLHEDLPLVEEFDVRVTKLPVRELELVTEGSRKWIKARLYLHDLLFHLGLGDLAVDPTPETVRRLLGHEDEPPELAAVHVEVTKPRTSFCEEVVVITHRVFSPFSDEPGKVIGHAESMAEVNEILADYCAKRFGR